VLCVGIWSVQRDWMVVTVCCGLSVVCGNMECAERLDGSDSLLWAWGCVWEYGVCRETG